MLDKNSTTRLYHQILIKKTMKFLYTGKCKKSDIYDTFEDV